jgi:hypothetical protein
MDSSPQHVTPAVDARTDAPAAKNHRIPLWLKLAFSAFMAVLVPVYTSEYGPTNFLYFCDVALFLTLIAVWRESALCAGMATIGIFLPQMLWCADFLTTIVGFKITGMTAYMFDAKLPLFLRGISFFHGWLPFLLLFLVARLGYERRALLAWTLTAWGLMFVSFFLMPRPGAILPNPKAPVNINYVFGPSDAAAQTWMPEWAWFSMMLMLMPILFYIPTHFLMKKLFKPATAIA